jgi:sRNA-binding regulator protein Hfq
MLCSFAGYGQADSIYLHNGTAVTGTVVRITDNVVVYHYNNEEVELSYGKYAVKKVVFGKSRRVQQVSKKIVTGSESDWENIVIIDNKDEAIGLHNEGLITAQALTIRMFQEQKSIEKLKREAAKLGCVVILDRTDKYRSTSLVKRGIAYKY